MISLQDAVEDLCRIAVVEGKSQSTKRLAMLAHMCVEQLAERGILGTDTEVPVPGIGRSKNWDVVWPRDGRVRLGISLKSILRNVAGTVPKPCRRSGRRDGERSTVIARNRHRLHHGLRHDWERPSAGWNEMG